MTDEGYACSGCGRDDCDGYSEFLYKGIWYTEKDLDVMGIDDTCDDERWICGDTEKPAKMCMIWSTEDKRY